MDLLLPLTLGLIVGLVLGVAAGAVVVSRGRRSREAAVAAELIAARQRAERAAGEAHALRTRLQTTEVLAARVVDMESDLAAAWESAERNADLAVRLEQELAARRTGRRLPASEPAASTAVPIRGRAPGPGRPGRAPGPGAATAPLRVTVPTPINTRAADPVAVPIAPVVPVAPEEPRAPSPGVAPAAVAAPSRTRPRPAVPTAQEPLPAALGPATTAAALPPSAEARAAGPEVSAVAAEAPAVDPFEPPPLRPRRTRATTAPRTYEPRPEPPEGSAAATPRHEDAPGGHAGIASAGPEPATPAVPEVHAHGWSPVRSGLADPWTWLGTQSPAGVPYTEDDLQRIHGVGPYLARRLRAEGILTWRQVVEWDEDDMSLVSRHIGSFPDRIRREDWAGSARALHEEAYGERLT